MAKYKVGDKIKIIGLMPADNHGPWTITRVSKNHYTWHKVGELSYNGTTPIEALDSDLNYVLAKSGLDLILEDLE